jgi:hypothetical protein
MVLSLDKYSPNRPDIYENCLIVPAHGKKSFGTWYPSDYFNSLTTYWKRSS